ncbi:hypothetical protein [Sphingomonas sp. GB1N7]|uniref:hypothetical protein n=1 Tax=Parasphingomonas caseinilytica TaxID=3096158 RepID=UPI002FC9B1C3
MGKILILSAILLTAAPALAKKPEKETDPNRVICRSSEVIGSRLATKKTCLTAMQWTQMEREQRETVERVQAYKPVNGQ